MLAAEFTGGYPSFGFAENTDDLFVGKTLLHGDVLMWLMKTLLTSGCTNQRGAGQSQYGSDDWQRFCRANNLVPSMSRRGNCWDNAVAESFFSSLKKERIRKRIYKTRDLARADIFDYIEVFYNRARRHSHLGGVSPEAFEQASS
ncbi:Integrase catalytic domain-containing protein [Klebsiella pneumoniae]